MMTFDGTSYRARGSDGIVVERIWPSTKTMLNPLWWIVWISAAAWRWLVSRPFLQWTFALPAVLLVCSCAIAMRAGGTVSKGSQGLRYRTMLAQALTKDDITAARLAGDALVRIYPESSEDAFRRAIVEEEAGDVDAARLLMTELATSERSAEAALWLASKVGDRLTFDSWGAEQKQEYLQWLRLAVENDGKNSTARRLLGDLLRKLGDNRGAYNVLRPIAESSEDINYIVAFLEKELGLLTEARRRALVLSRTYQQRLDAKGTDIEARTRLASMLLMLEQENDALTLLQNGLATSSDEEKVEIQRAIAEVLVILSTKTAAIDNSTESLIKSLELLKEAMKFDPDNRTLIEVVSQACIRVSQSENKELAELKEALIKGVSTDTMHFILGTVALNQNKQDEASFHLEIAIKNNPNLPGLLNNLALAESKREGGDLDRALRLAEAAVKAMPQHPYIRETRGQIFTRLRRYTDAISDLEYALAAVELRPEIRKSLADCYEGLGHPDIAKEQRRLGEQGK